MSKRVGLILTLTLCTLGVWAQIPSDQGGSGKVNPPIGSPAITEDPIELGEARFDFGKIPQGKPVYHPFEVRNKGSKAIKLDNVQASCGCTTPEWSREEIAPGGTAIIRVGYNAAAEGAFEKPVTIHYGDRVKQFTIAGQVWRTPEGPAPRNASVELLKKQSHK